MRCMEEMVITILREVPVMMRYGVIIRQTQFH